MFLYASLLNTGDSSGQYCLPANDNREHTSSCATSEPISVEEQMAENYIWENPILTLITKFPGIFNCVILISLILS